jgi:hypothetical protein
VNSGAYIACRRDSARDTDPVSPCWLGGLRKAQTIKGFSSTREVTKAIFNFAAASGQNLGPATLERDDAGSALFVPYYSNQYAPFLYNQALSLMGASMMLARSR